MDNFEDIGREQLIDALKALDRTLDEVNKDKHLSMVVKETDEHINPKYLVK